MFRLTSTVQRRNFSSRLYHSTAALSMPSKFDPKDWKIIETSPGGVDLDFVNRKTGESTWYTPEGMSGAEIFAIRGARKYWVNVEDVEEYIKKKAAQKAKNGGKDYMDAIAELEASKDVSKKD